MNEIAINSTVISDNIWDPSWDGNSIDESKSTLLFHVWQPSYFALQFVEEYLSVYKIPLGIKICDGTWNVFISEVINRYGNIFINGMFYTKMGLVDFIL